MNVLCHPFDTPNREMFLNDISTPGCYRNAKPTQAGGTQVKCPFTSDDQTGPVPESRGTIF